MDENSSDIRQAAGGTALIRWICGLAALLLLSDPFPIRAEGSSPSSIDPLQVTSADSSVSLRFQFVGQLRAEWRDVEQSGDDDRDQTYTLKARRIRPSMTLTLPEQRMTFRLHLSTAPGSVELMDFYFNYGLGGSTQIRAGQYKVPFTRYRIQSFQRLTFIDWAIVSKYFGAERQVGVAIHNGYERPPRLGYELGVFDGTNARASQAVGLPGIYGEDVTNPSDLADPGPSANIHPELVAHVSYNRDEINVSSDSDDEGGNWRYSLGVSAAWDLDPIEYYDLAVRVAPELLIKGHGASAMAVGYAGFVGVDDSHRTRLAMTGLLAQTSVRLSDRFEVSLRYAIVDIDDYVVNDAFNRGRRLIALAEEQFSDEVISQGDLDETVDQYEDAGTVLREQELTAGLNVYLIGHSLKWQSDLGWLRHTLRAGDPLDDFCIRSHFQIAF